MRGQRQHVGGGVAAEGVPLVVEGIGEVPAVSVGAVNDRHLVAAEDATQVDRGEAPLRLVVESGAEVPRHRAVRFGRRHHRRHHRQAGLGADGGDRGATLWVGGADNDVPLARSGQFLGDPSRGGRVIVVVVGNDCKDRVFFARIPIDRPHPQFNAAQ